MAMRFIDSMAHYNGTSGPRKWTFFNSTWNASGGRRNGPYLSGLGAMKTLTMTNHWYLGCAALNGNNVGIIAAQNGGIQVGGLTANADATLSVYCGANKIFTSTLSVTDPNSWHYYEVAWVFSGAGTANLNLQGTLWVDGDLWGTYNGTGDQLVNNYITQFAGANAVGYSADSPGLGGFQDFYAFDNAGSDINGHTTTLTSNIGDVAIDAVFPDADVTTQWGTFGGDGTHAYSCVDETAPDDDTSYVTTTATGSTEAFNYQPITTFTGTIFGAQYLLCAKKDVEGTREIAMVVGGTQQNSSNFLTTTNYLSDYYVYYICPMDTDNGTLWTPTVFNTETFGVTLVG
jgi:hypothetical protein